MRINELIEQLPNPYLHAELSLLAFHERVLNMALNPKTPLLERMKFLCIFSSNMDEFFEIRVSGLKAKAESSISGESFDGLSPQLALEKISERARTLVKLQYETLNEQVLPQLEEYGIKFLQRDEWSEAQSKWLKSYINYHHKTSS